MRTPTIIAITVAGAIAVAAMSSLGRPPATRGRVIPDADTLRKEWGARIAAVGAPEAYAELARAAAAKDDAVAHGMAHVFGEMLHAAEGIDGIRVCDARMSFGCYHGLVERALAEGGVAALPEVDAACVAAFGPDDTGCRHGIGHGLLESFGPGAVEKALASCASLRPPSLLGCTQGVFMEHANAARERGRVLDPAAPFEPCASVAEEHRPSCWFEQPYRWREALGDDARTFGGWCLGLPTPSEREACLLGLGRALLELGGYDAARAADGCGRVGPGDADLVCRAGAYWLLAALGKEGAETVCPDDADECRTAAAAISPVP